MKNSTRIIAAIASVAATTAIVAGATLASTDNASDINNANNKQGWHCQNFSKVDRDAVREALDNNDYNAWVAAHKEGLPMLDQVNEENFAKMVEAHELMQAGDKEGAKSIMDELGIEGPRGPRNGERGIFDQEKKAAVDLAIENNDYSAWVAAHKENAPVLEKINAENFSKLVEAHNLMKSGDKESAKAIMDELGIEGPRGLRGGNFMKKLAPRMYQK